MTTNKIAGFGVVVAIVIAIASLLIALGAQPRSTAGGNSFGSSANGGNVTDFNAVNTTDAAGYFIQGVQMISSVFGTLGTFTQGGGIDATSTLGTAVPLLASDFDVENVIDVTLNISSGTLTFPATTTLTSFIPTAGQTRTLFVRNATTTAATNLTIAGGTGVLVKFASTTPATTGVITGDTDGANYAMIVLTRKANTDIEALVSLFKD